MKTWRIAAKVTVATAWVALNQPAWAVDGVVEISQAKVLAGGGHFPFVISSSGSYRLSSSLNVAADSSNPSSVADRIAILINAPRVTIDLNGFSIEGGTSCSGTPTVCAPTGTGDGIKSTQMDIAVANGNIQGMGGSGVNLAFGKVHGVSVSGNGDTGINIGTRGSVTNCSVAANGGRGIHVVRGEVSDCVVEQQNAVSGIEAVGVIRNNYVNQSGSGHAMAVGDSVVAHNSTYTVNSPGITAFNAMVIGNRFHRQSSEPAAVLNTSGYTQNHFRCPFQPNPVEGGVNLGANACNGGACP